MDSIGTNTLVSHATPTADMVNFREGAASVELLKADRDSFDIADAALDAGFPLKIGDPNKNISVCFWVRFITLPLIVQHSLCWIKFGSLHIVAYHDAGGDTNFRLYIYNMGMNTYTHASAILANRWYHVGVTYQNSDFAYRMHIYDATAGAPLGVDLVGISENIVLTIQDMIISDLISAAHAVNGNVDEIVVFDRVLSVTEINKIRAGTYGGSGELPVFGSLTNAFWFVKNKIGMMAKL